MSTIAPPKIILFCDDDPAIRQVSGIVLRHAGYRVIPAADGAAALAAAANEARIDLAIVDVILPDADGRGLIHQLRQSHPDLRTLLASGLREAAVSDPREAADAPAGTAGETPILYKPFAAHELLAAVRQALAST